MAEKSNGSNLQASLSMIDHTDAGILHELHILRRRGTLKEGIWSTRKDIRALAETHVLSIDFPELEELTSHERKHVEVSMERQRLSQMIRSRMRVCRTIGKIKRGLGAQEEDAHAKTRVDLSLDPVEGAKSTEFESQLQILFSEIELLCRSYETECLKRISLEKKAVVGEAEARIAEYRGRINEIDYSMMEELAKAKETGVFDSLMASIELFLIHEAERRNIPNFPKNRTVKGPQVESSKEENILFDQITSLIRQRLSVVEIIGGIKGEFELPIYNGAREREHMTELIGEADKAELPSHRIEELFSMIMTLCRMAQEVGQSA